MVRFLLGVVVATVAVFFWGFAYWGMSSFPYDSWKQTKDDAAAGVVLRELFVENGVYFVPGRGHEADEMQKLTESGPVAMIHMIARDGRPMFDGAMMAKGFALDAVVVLVIALFLWQAAPALSTYIDRVRHAALAGIAAAVLINFGDVVWWGMSVEWKFHQALYNFGAFVVAGLILAAFMPAARTPRETM